MKYNKPHLTFSQQIELLASRGLEISDLQAAEGVMRRLGYYRFAAYAYPFREVLDPDEPRHSSVQFRSDRFVPGTKFEWIAELASFDRRLRSTLLVGLECFELALRVQVAYVLGRRSAFAHLDPGQLDPVSTSVERSPDTTVYEEWLEKFTYAQRSAVEDFTTHYNEKYDGSLPIWVAIEVMDFGALTRLMSFGRQADRREIGAAFGLSNPNVIDSVSKTFNYIRNVSAHHGRIWNRALTYEIRKISPELAPELDHFREVVPALRKKIYRPLAVLAHATQAIPGVGFSITNQIRDLVEEFPQNAGLSPELHMGFVAGWRDLPLWRDPDRTYD